MTHPQQIIPIISGWNRIIFDHGLIPSDQMLAQLLRPNIDLNSAAFCWYEMSETDNIPDLDSQLILQAWSNHIILKMCIQPSVIEYPQNIDKLVHFIIKISNDIGLDAREPLYHNAVSRYTHSLVPREVLPNSKEIFNYVKQLDSKFFQFNWEGFENLENQSKLLGDHRKYSLELEERFLDYQLANEYLDSFYQCALDKKDKDKEVLELIRSFRSKVDDYNKVLRSSYHCATTTVDKETIPIARWCRYCRKWFEANAARNGRLFSSHCGKEACKAEWERSRRTPGNKFVGVNKLQKEFPTRKKCKICGEKRFVYGNRTCKECLRDLQK